MITFRVVARSTEVYYNEIIIGQITKGLLWLNESAKGKPLASDDLLKIMEELQKS